VATREKEWMSGRYVSANWDVEELQERKREFGMGRFLEGERDGEVWR
jgi:hypothetical protein